MRDGSIVYSLNGDRVSSERLLRRPDADGCSIRSGIEHQFSVRGGGGGFRLSLGDVAVAPVCGDFDYKRQGQVVEFRIGGGLEFELDAVGDDLEGLHGGGVARWRIGARRCGR